MKKENSQVRDPFILTDTPDLSNDYRPKGLGIVVVEFKLNEDRAGEFKTVSGIIIKEDHTTNEKIGLVVSKGIDVSDEISIGHVVRYMKQPFRDLHVNGISCTQINEHDIFGFINPQGRIKSLQIGDAARLKMAFDKKQEESTNFDKRVEKHAELKADKVVHGAKKFITDNGGRA